MRGRKPLTASQRKLAGRSHKKKKPGKPVVEKISAPDMPSQFADDAVAAQAWIRLRRDLIEMRVLTKRDWMMLEILCSTYSEYEEARRLLHKEGRYLYVGKGRTKRRVLHPAMKALRDARKDIQRISTEFGLSPVSRVRVTQADDAIEDENNKQKKQANAQQSAENFIFGKRGAQSAKVVGSIGR